MANFVLGIFWKIFGGIILLILAVVTIVLIGKAILTSDERKAENRNQVYLEGHVNEELTHPQVLTF